MREKIEEIKKLESAPKLIKNLYSKEEIEEFLKLYKDLPTTVHNKKQNVIKKRWLQGYNEKLEKLFHERLKNEIGEFKMDNLKDENGKDIYGLIQESYNPIGLHVDACFDLDNLIYKQSLIPLICTNKKTTTLFSNSKITDAQLGRARDLSSLLCRFKSYLYKLKITKRPLGLVV